MTEQRTKPRTTGEKQEPLRVLVVCTGNTCRSPMAAALLNDSARPREVCTACAEDDTLRRTVLAVSAGLAAHAGEPISPEAVTALEEAGILSLSYNDYRAHRAQNVTPKLMEEADVVLAVSAAHAMQLLWRFPEFSTKIRTLPMDITDPYGGGQEAYRTCLAQLRMALSLALFEGEETP